jgi:hypothetical protein
MFGVPNQMRQMRALLVYPKNTTTVDGGRGFAGIPNPYHLPLLVPLCICDVDCAITTLIVHCTLYLFFLFPFCTVCTVCTVCTTKTKNY